MTLELLCNELLLYVFEFLDDVYLYRAFYGLNHRFNTLLFNHMPCLDFRSIRKCDFHTICEKYAPVYVDRITSICFSDDYDTPQQTKYYLDHNMPLRLFSNLRSLSLYYIRSYEIIEEIFEECRLLPHLTRLFFIHCRIQPDTSTNQSSFNSYQSLVDHIWYLPKLTHCHLGIIFVDSTCFPIPTVTSLSLKHLSVEYVYVGFSQLEQLIQHTPSLQHLRLSINVSRREPNLSFAISSIVSLVLHIRDAPVAIGKLLKCMPSLIHLTVDSSDTYLGYIRNWLDGELFQDPSYQHNFNSVSTSPPIYMNGCRWKDIIVNHLSKLKTFQLKMNIQFWSCRNNARDKEEVVDKLLTSFSSEFWMRERRWFVRCDWNPNIESTYICLYTLPYAFDDLNIYSVSIRSKSTSPSENDYWSYDHVRNLHDAYPLSASSSSVLSPGHFSNITYLSMDLPFSACVSSAPATFNHLKTLAVYISNDDVIVYNQLQMLLDQAPLLYSLKLSCGRLSAPELGLLTNRSASIRCLDLDKYIRHKGWSYFSNQQCVALCHSPLGIRCEVLRIRVENTMDVLELVYSMPYLRALNVQVSNTNDKLVHWLRHHLDSTCTVVKQEFDPYYIQLWIR